MRRIPVMVLTMLALGRAGQAQVATDTTSYAWLTAAAGAAVDSGEFEPNDARQKMLYKNAEQYARRAVAANPKDADGHFELARALGRNAQSMGTRDRIRFAREVRDEALAALAINPKHAGALHVLGEWNAEVMRLSGISRLIARKFLGGSVFKEASWDNATRYLEEAVALEPDRIVHHLDLAAVYADRKQTSKAIAEYEWIARAPDTEFNDANYKTEAAKRLEALR